MALVDFKASNFQNEPGLAHCIVDDMFVPDLNKMNDIAARYGITVVVIDAIRYSTVVKGAIVPPAVHGNHLVGCAVDVNLIWKGMYYNSTMLETAGGEVRQFINDCKEAGIRWGGDFKKNDPVHFDNGINITNPALWQLKYNALHSSQDVPENHE